MKKYLKSSVITPIVEILILVVYGANALLQSEPINSGVPQESFFPLLICLVGIPAAVSLLVSAIKKVNAEGSEASEPKSPARFKPLYVVILTFLFVFLFELVGYWFTAPFYIFGIMLVYDDKPDKIVKKIIFSLLIAVFVYILYTYAFDIRFPSPF